jgi:hypothetical protein
MWKYLPLIFFISPAYAIPVVPNFTSATSTSRSVTTNNLTEQIREVRYNSGYTYSVTGSGISCGNCQTISMPNATVTETVNGTTYEWTGLNLDQKPNWQQTSESFQFSEFYKGPSLESITDITRSVQSEIVTDTTVIFSN